jgi:general secretion pathway protein A
MYEHFYELKEKPFNLLADPAFLYLSKKHELALSYLEYGLSEQAGFIVITGEVGSGKTTLIKYLLTKLEKTSAKTAMIFNTNITPREFLEIVLREWDIAGAGKEKADLYDSLNNFLLQEYIRKNQVLLIIDEAQNLSSETLEEIRMLSNLNDEKQPLLHIILLGQPNLRDRLNQKTLEQLRQRIAVHYHLDPLDYEDTAHYIRHRLQKAGAQNPELFMADAIDSIYQHSRGIPRVINVLCDTALVYGFAEGAEKIGKPIIESVIEERVKGGLIVLDETAPAAADGPRQSQDDGLGKELEAIKEHYAALNKNIFELTLLVKKLYAEKEPAKKEPAGAVHRSRKPAGSAGKKERLPANKKMNREINVLRDRIKGLGKKQHKNNAANRRVVTRVLVKTLGR